MTRRPDAAVFLGLRSTLSLRSTQGFLDDTAARYDDWYLPGGWRRRLERDCEGMGIPSLGVPAAVVRS